jgi:hypothetical protein
MDELAEDTRLIRELVEFCELPPATVAKRAGVAPSTISRPFNGTATTRLGRSVLEKLFEAFPQFPGWNKSAAHLATAEIDETPEGMVAIRHIDLGFGMGAAIMDTEIFEDRAETLDFPRTWLRMITPNSPSQLCWSRGRGDSMYPTIGDGDVILIDRAQREIYDGDLCWAAYYGNTAVIKRLRPMPDGGVKMLSDNANVSSETAYDGELNIFGRVIAVVKKL